MKTEEEELDGEEEQYKLEKLAQSVALAPVMAS